MRERPPSPAQRRRKNASLPWLGERGRRVGYSSPNCLLVPTTAARLIAGTGAGRATGTRAGLIAATSATTATAGTSAGRVARTRAGAAATAAAASPGLVTRSGTSRVTRAGARPSTAATCLGRRAPRTGDGTSFGSIGICPARSRAHFGCRSGEDNFVILSRGKLDPKSAGNAGGQRRPTGKFQSPRDNSAAGRFGWGNRLPNLMARTILHLDPPFALPTKMAAGTPHTS